MDRQRKRKAQEVAWTDAETDVVIERYADGGSGACLPYLPGRTKSQVQNKARGLGIRYEGPTVSGGNNKRVEPNWELPTHDYCEADIALRQWRVPGMGTIAPDLGIPVGVLSPSLGLVLGVAA